jgi:DNA-binding transcriptional MerR regulator
VGCYIRQDMYTIKQASIRTGVGVPLLRAWERRYGLPMPERTHSGYRLYDERSLERVRRMRGLIEAGWAPSQAARSILDAPELEPAAVASEPAAVASEPAAVASEAIGPTTDGANPFLAAARALDESAMEAILGEAFAAMGADEALERFVLPALVSVGEAWSRGQMDVASEHAATNAVMRRLAALYEAAGPSSAVIASGSFGFDCAIGLPPGARHEAGALAFAVACRRAGLRVLYLGADVPLESWLAVVRDQPEVTVVLGGVTALEARSAAGVAATVHASRPDLLIAVGGAGRAEAAAEGVLLLPDGLRGAVTELARARSEIAS